MRPSKMTLRAKALLCAVVVVALGSVAAVSASAQGVYVGVTPPEVGGVDLGSPPGVVVSNAASGIQVAAAAPARVDAFAVTGSDILQLVGLALVLSGVGVALVQAGRRKPAPADPS